MLKKLKKLNTFSERVEKVAIFDSLATCGLMQDDEQIDDLHIIRCDKIKGGKIRVRLFEIV